MIFFFFGGGGGGVENTMKQVVLDTNFGLLINLKLKFKWVSEKGIENILLSQIFIYLFICLFIYLFIF